MRPIRFVLAAVIVLLGGVAARGQDRTVDLLRLLADTAGAPGFEEPIRKVMVEQMKPYASSITFDGLGPSSPRKAPPVRASWWMRTWTNWAAWCAASHPKGC